MRTDPNRSIAGAIASAFIASLCCAGPLVAASVGVTGVAGLFGPLEPFRPLFIALAIALLVHAFVRPYRRAPRDAAPTETAHRRRGFLWGGAIATAALLAVGLPWVSDALAQANGSGIPSSGADSEVVLTVAGADCASCLVGVRSALREVPGVVAMDAGAEASQLRVRYASAQVAPEKILEVARSASELEVRMER